MSIPVKLLFYEFFLAANIDFAHLINNLDFITIAAKPCLIISLCLALQRK